jgi:hypothetical protein
MPKSKTNKSHKDRLAKYKANKKKEQELFKKKMIDNYIKIQEQAYAEQEAHTSTEAVTGPEIDIDSLNSIDVDDLNFVDVEENPILIDGNINYLGDLELTTDEFVEDAAIEVIEEK